MFESLREGAVNIVHNLIDRLLLKPYIAPLWLLYPHSEKTR